MAGARRKRALVVVVLGLALLPVVPQAALADPTPVQRVKIWTANLNQFRDNPSKLITNMVAQWNRPDFVALQGVVTDAQLEGFREELQRRVDTNDRRAIYRAVHGDRRDPTDEFRSNVALIWDSSRFTFVDDERWLDLHDAGDRGCVPKRDATEPKDNSKYSLAIKLEDTKNSNRSIVVASVHIGAGSGARCKEENVAKIHDQIEGFAPLRRLTLVAGDFNMSPQDTDGDEVCSISTHYCGPPETEPDCWYENMSVAITQSCEADSTQLHSYVDTVSAEVGGGDGLCNQWTRGRSTDTRNPDGETPGVYDDVDRSSYCHDYLDTGGHYRGDGGATNLRRDRNRIDYVWARWENAQGNAITTPAFVDAIASHVVQASADPATNPGNPADRYSDHRAVYAVVKVSVE